MTDYTDLVHILRQLNLKYGDMAAAAIEAQAKRIEELEASIDKNDEWAKWFIEKTDARIVELEAALKPFADKATACEQRYSDFAPEDDRTFAFTLGDLRRARKVLGEKE